MLIAIADEWTVGLHSIEKLHNHYLAVALPPLHFGSRIVRCTYR